MTRYQNASVALPSLLEDLLRAPEQASRNGTMRELLMNQVILTHPDSAGITTPERKASLPAQIAETMWLLAGRDDIDWLSYYLPRAKDFSDDGATWRGAYGPRIRKSGTWQFDQLAHVVKLIKQDVTTRRAVISIYNPDIDAKDGKDIPCNDFLQFIQRDGVLHGHVFIRSNDLMWGWSGINAFEWTALLNVVASLTGLERGSITFSITSLHLYERHYKKAQRIVDACRAGEHPIFKPNFAPDPVSSASSVLELDNDISDWFQIEYSIREGASNIREMIAMHRNPLFRAWLWVIWAWHQQNPMDALPMYLLNTSLAPALQASPKRKTEPVKPDNWNALGHDFTANIGQLHAEKNKAYGDSWKKRGEMLGIMANIARKVDRLGVDGAGDTSADTALDLLVYLLKYTLWLEANVGAPDAGFDDYTSGDPHVQAIFEMLADLEGTWTDSSDNTLIAELKKLFDELEIQVTEKRLDRIKLVQEMTASAYPLALRLWAAEQPTSPGPDLRGKFVENDLSSHVELLNSFSDTTTSLSHAQRNATRSWNPEEK